VVIALPLLSGVLDGFDDVLIAGTTAEVPGDALADLLLAGVGLLRD
jgi:hypothetical protein